MNILKTTGKCGRKRLAILRYAMSFSCIVSTLALVGLPRLGAQPAPQVPAPAVGGAQPTPQAPAQAGGGAAGRGGRGGAAAGPAFSVGQKITYAAAMDVPLALAAKVTEARAALAKASLTVPLKQSDLTAKARAVADAELALATARANGFQKVQSSPQKFNAEQVAYVRGGANPSGGGGLNAPGGEMPYDDYTGFTKIFDGKTFTGWSGETDGWIIGDDALQMAVQRLPGQHHIHFTGLPGVSPILKDFDFKVEMRVATPGNYNGGIQYRARLLNASHGPDRSIYNPATIADPLGKPLPAGITTLAQARAAGLATGQGDTANPWQVSGYQLDITPGFGGVGSLYEGQGRGVAVNAGEIVQFFPGGVKFVIGRSAENTAQYNKPLGEWNQLEVIASGNTLIHMVNGHVVAVTIDDDPVRRALQGMLSLQCEGGEIWYRNVYLKQLP